MGATRKFCLPKAGRQKSNGPPDAASAHYAEVPLPHNSLVIMWPPCQEEWRHEVSGGGGARIMSIGPHVGGQWSKDCSLPLHVSACQLVFPVPVSSIASGMHVCVKMPRPFSYSITPPPLPGSPHVHVFDKMSHTLSHGCHCAPSPDATSCLHRGRWPLLQAAGVARKS